MPKPPQCPPVRPDQIIIKGDTYRSFNTPAQIQGYSDAYFDRFAYDAGLVKDAHIREPGRAPGTKRTRKHTFMTGFEGEALSELTDTKF